MPPIKVKITNKSYIYIYIYIYKDYFTHELSLHCQFIKKQNHQIIIIIHRNPLSRAALIFQCPVNFLLMEAMRF